MSELIEEESQEITLTQQEQMKAILYQFIKLYDRWAEDRQVAAKQGADIEEVIDEFAQEVERFSNIENAVIAKLKEGLSQTTVSISAMVHDAVSHSVNKAIDESTYKIRDSVRQAENLFSEYQSTLNWSHWKTIAITSITSIVASLLAVWWFMPRPTTPLTDAQIKTYRAGQVFEAFWPKLSERQQTWLGNLALGKTNNHEKLVEDTKNNYSGINDSQANDITGVEP